MGERGEGGSGGGDMFLIIDVMHKGALPGCTLSTTYSFPSTPSSDGSDNRGEEPGSARWRGGSKVGDKLLPHQALNVLVSSTQCSALNSSVTCKLALHMTQWKKARILAAKARYLEGATVARLPHACMQWPPLTRCCQK